MSAKLSLWSCPHPAWADPGRSITLEIGYGKCSTVGEEHGATAHLILDDPVQARTSQDLGLGQGSALLKCSLTFLVNHATLIVVALKKSATMGLFLVQRPLPHLSQSVIVVITRVRALFVSIRV